MDEGQNGSEPQTEVQGAEVNAVETLAQAREKIEQECAEELNRLLLRFGCRLGADIVISDEAGITQHIKVRAIG